MRSQTFYSLFFLSDKKRALEKNEIKILIVEDDKKLSQVLAQVLSEDGYNVFSVHDPEKAISLSQDESFSCFVVDCLLPKMNGVSLIKELKKVNKNFRSLLITGVYKDKAFFQEAISETRAYDILTKPFDPKTLVLTINNLFSDVLMKKRRHSLELLTYNSIKKADVKKIFANEKNFHGFELPYIYSLFFHSRLTGRLDLTYKNEELSYVEFKEGEVVRIHLEDKDSYFGVLLVENGFTTLNELKSSLQKERKKPLGEVLVEINALSPHSIKIIQKSQARIRFSKTVKEGDLEIRLSEELLSNENSDSKSKEQSKQMVYIHKDQFMPLFSEWILSRLKVDWLKSFYVPWYDYKIEKTAYFSEWEKFKSLPIFKIDSKRIKVLISLIEKGMSLNSIVEHFKEKGDYVLKALYFLILSKMIYFSEESREASDDKKHLRKLKRINKDIQEKNHFELLGLSATASSIDITKAYQHFANVLHPDRLKSKSVELKTLSHKIFSKILSTYNILKDDRSRKRYIENMKKEESQNRLKGENVSKSALLLLLNAKYGEAYKSLEKLKEKKQSAHNFMVYYIWAFIKSENYKYMLSEKDLIPYIESLFHTIPSEERHNHYYFYVKGLFHMLKEEPILAKKCFEQTITMKPDFPISRHELSFFKKAL